MRVRASVEAALVVSPDFLVRRSVPQVAGLDLHFLIGNEISTLMLAQQVLELLPRNLPVLAKRIDRKECGRLLVKDG